MKKQLLIVGMTVVLIIVGLSGCTEQGFSGGLYVNEEYGFSFNEPDGWIIDNSQSLDGEIISFMTSDYHTTITVSWLEGVEGVPFSYFWTFILDEISALSDFVLISNSTISSNGLDVYEYVFTYSAIIDDEDTIIKSKVVEFDIGKDYIAFYYAVDPPDIYDDSMSIFEDVLDSFELI